LDGGDPSAAPEGHRDAGTDLVEFALPGVQRFIEEARSTSDVSAASGIYSSLAQELVASLAAEPGAELVLPAAGPEAPGTERGMPNRVVALLPADTGADGADRAVKAARKAWEGWVRKLLHLAEDDPVPEQPGFPLLQWVSVPARSGDYEEQWRRAQRLLAARRRVRDFVGVPEQGWRQRALCSLAPRWPAEEAAPPGVSPHDKDTALSLVGWVKRRWTHLNGEDGFPSTASIASVPYRRAVLEHLADDNVRQALGALAGVARAIDTTPETPVPGLAPLIPDSGPGRWLVLRGGPWVYPDRWQPAALARELGVRGHGSKAGSRDELARIATAADAGRKAAAHLRDVMAGLGVPLADYLAVVVQDIDSMGRFLSGAASDAEGSRIKVIPNEHRRLSADLLHVAAAQRAVLRSPELLGVPVYVGGDDLLAFTPAATALGAARACQQASARSLPSASTAVLYFHYHASIQRAMSDARRLLGTAKDRVPGKHALAVGYLRRSGASAVSIQRWDGPVDGDTAGLFGIFARGQENRLSPRLVTDLERDASELTALARYSERLYLAELARLVRRHREKYGNGDRETAIHVAAALKWLGDHEYADDVPGPQAAARVGVFLRQEAR
jgi:CRISPR-associated protein Cmr2